MVTVVVGATVVVGQTVVGGTVDGEAVLDGAAVDVVIAGAVVEGDTVEVTTVVGTVVRLVTGATADGLLHDVAAAATTATIVRPTPHTDGRLEPMAHL